MTVAGIRLITYESRVTDRCGASGQGCSVVAAPGPNLPEDERRALLLGPDWISLELAARFAADALNESYFGWNPERFAGRGEHNLVRARGQLSLHRAFVETRPKRARLLAVSVPQ